MTLTATTVEAQTESISFEFDLRHSPAKVWRALTDPALLAEWLLPVVGLNLEPGAAFTFTTQPTCSRASSELSRPMAPRNVTMRRFV